MRILVIAVLALSVMAAQKKRKATPNLIHIDNKAYQQSHAQIEYDVDSFTSPRTQQLKTAQKNKTAAQKAIQHSQQTGFVQIQQETDQFILMNQDEDLSSELMTEQQVQQALLTAEDFNNVPNIEMQAESNYQAPDVAQDDVNESYYIPVVTEGDGTLEEVQNSDEEPQQNPDIEMPSLDEASSSFLQ